MLIFWKKRLVFLSTPKTGTSSIETALESLAHVALRRPTELKHMNARSYRDHFAPLIEGAAGEKFTTVALMREPIDWLGSWYRYRQREDIPRAEKSTGHFTFEEAAQGYLASPRTNGMDVGSQARFLCLADGTPGVDRIFRYEDIDTFVHFLEDRLGCEIHLPRLNVSPKAQLDLTDATRAALRQALAADYALYDRLT